MKKTTLRSVIIACAFLIANNYVHGWQDAQAERAAVREAAASRYNEAIAQRIGGFVEREQDLSKLPKMEKDIVILQNVLGDLFSSKEHSFYSSRSAKGLYIPGNGVIFSMGNSLYGNAFVEVLRVSEARVVEGKKVEDEISADEINKKTEDELKTKSREFLTNYGSLLSELKPGEKVMLNIDYNEMVDRSNAKKADGQSVIYVSPRANKKRMQSSITQKTLTDFTSGKINLEQAMNAVKVDILDGAEDERTDAKILAGILDDLLQSSMDGKFKRRSKTNWTYFDGFGLMFNIQMSTQAGRGLHVSSVGGSGSVSIISGKKDEVEIDIDELKKEVEEAYPDFENMLKENIIQYGRTLRSLKDGESIIVNVDFGSVFRDSKMPRSIRMVVPKSSIDAYAKGQKTLDQIKKEVDVTQLQSAISNNGVYFSPASEDFFPTGIERVQEVTAPRVVRGTSVKSN